jgi:hypothetical protein
MKCKSLFKCSYGKEFYNMLYETSLYNYIHEGNAFLAIDYAKAQGYIEALMERKYYR